MLLHCGHVGPLGLTLEMSAATRFSSIRSRHSRSAKWECTRRPLETPGIILIAVRKGKSKRPRAIFVAFEFWQRDYLFFFPSIVSRYGICRHRTKPNLIRERPIPGTVTESLNRNKQINIHIGICVSLHK